MADLRAMTVDDLISVAASLRQAGDGASCMEHVAREVVGRMSRELADEHGRSACALVRLYVTVRFGDLEAQLQQAALGALPADLRHALSDDTRCITLLATAGVETAWNDRRSYSGHQVIPLVSEAVVDRLPMVVGVLRAFGIDPKSVVHPDPQENAARSGRRYDVFYVPEAESSPFIPDKAFVERHGVRSALGFGGVLPSGELFAVIVFSTVAVPQATAELLRSLALTVQSVVVPHTYRVFDPAAQA